MQVKSNKNILVFITVLFCMSCYKTARADLSATDYGFGALFTYGFGGGMDDGGNLTSYDNGNAELFTYDKTATDPTTGASATANVRMVFSLEGEAVGFTSVQISLTQSNPNGAVLTPADLLIGGYTGEETQGGYDESDSSYLVSSPDYGSTIYNFISLMASGNVGPSVGDFSSADVSLDSLDVSKTDHTPGDTFNAALSAVASGEINDDDGFGGQHYYGFDLRVLDPGGTATAGLTGSTASALPDGVPEPASMLLPILLGFVMRRRTYPRPVTAGNPQ